MFNLDIDTVLLKIKTTRQRLVFVAFIVTKKFSIQCFHPHLKSNCLLFCMHIHSIKKRLEQTSLLCYSIVQ